MQRTIELARRYDIPVYTHIYEFARHGAAGAHDLT